MRSHASDQPKTVNLSEIVIRRVRSSDRRDLADFYGTLSAETLRARFLGFTRGLSCAAVRSFCTLDHTHDEGFVALENRDCRDRIVGHVCLIEIGARQLELAICLADDYHGRGLGSQLFEAALAWSRDHKFTSMLATCFADNSRVLALLSAPLGGKVTIASAGLVDVIIPLAPEARGPRRPRSGISRSCRASSPRRRPPGLAVVGSASRESS